MENVKIFVDGIEKNVFGLFYVFDSKYYFVYTEKEVDENNYVILYMSLVGKETKNTETGLIETGAMIGVEITNPDDQQKAQTSISYIVEDKKNNTINPQIQYLPMTMINQLKIISKKRFRLLKSIMEENFKLDFNTLLNTQEFITPEVQPISVENLVQPVIEQPIKLQDLTQSIEEQSTIIESPVAIEPVEPVSIDKVQPIKIEQQNNEQVSIDNNVIIDYRSKYFEETEKNKELENQIEVLTQKLNDIKKVID